MAYTEAGYRAAQKYIKENLEEVRFRVKKGEKQRVKAEAEAERQGVSMAKYIIQAINDKAGKQLLTPPKDD